MGGKEGPVALWEAQMSHFTLHLPLACEYIIADEARHIKTVQIEYKAAQFVRSAHLEHYNHCPA